MLHARAGGVEQVRALVQLDAVPVAARLERRVQVGVVAARDVWQAVVQRLGRVGVGLGLGPGFGFGFGLGLGLGLGSGLGLGLGLAPAC